MNHALISLAANDEKKEATLARTLQQIHRCSVVVVRHTPVYRSDAAGGKQQPQYANALLQIETDESYECLRSRFKALETAAGRTPASKASGIVPLDIDIISWNGNILKAADMDYEYMRQGLKLLE